MSSPSRSLYWAGSILGGLSFASVSAGIMWVAEKKEPNGKTIGRDVILGIILFFLLLQIIPESTTALITSLMGVFTFSGVSTDISNSLEIVADEMEVRVGVPKF